MARAIRSNSLLIPALLLIAGPFVLGSSEYEESTLTKVGDKSPQFSATDLDGRTLSSKTLEGKVTYINFFATWCGPCMSEFPRVETEIWGRFKDHPDFQMVNIGREHSEAELKEFKAEKSVKSPLAADPKREVYGLFATQYIPRSVVIGPEGTIVYQHVGFSPAEFSTLVAQIDELLK